MAWPVQRELVDQVSLEGRGDILILQRSLSVPLMASFFVCFVNVFRCQKKSIQFLTMNLFFVIIFHCGVINKIPADGNRNIPREEADKGSKGAR